MDEMALYDALIFLLKRDGSPEALALVKRLQRHQARRRSELIGGRYP